MPHLLKRLSDDEIFISAFAGLVVTEHGRHPERGLKAWADATICLSGREHIRSFEPQASIFHGFLPKILSCLRKTWAEK